MCIAGRPERPRYFLPMDSNLSAQTIRIELDPEQSPSTARARLSQTQPRASLNKRPAEINLYQEFMQGTYDAVIITDLNGNIVDANTRAIDFFQHTIAELCKLSLRDIISGFDPNILAVIRENLDHQQFTFITASARRKDASLFPTDIAPGQLHLGGERYLSFFIRDVTRRKQAEERVLKMQTQLDRAERLKMVDRIAGQIAHDFNNLLMPLMIYPGLIKEQLPPDSPALPDLQTIEKAVQAMAEINQQLMALSRRGYHEQTILNINNIIQETLNLLTRSSRSGDIAVKLDLAADLANMKGAAHQLTRVIQNLCQNAFDAMSERGGTLTVRTENIQLDDPLLESLAGAKGAYLKITVGDTGTGIPQKHRELIFDPFFTTKHSGRRGSGLGLSIVQGIVKDHHGHIDFESAPDRGTTFNLYFPACQENLCTPLNAPLHGGNETILIVDDDPLLTEVISRMLTKLGYTALSASSGEAACKLFNSYAAAKRPLPDLLILDMVMNTGLNGTQTYQQIKSINPEQKAIILSGYEESAKVAMALDLGAHTYLRKPVSIEKLAHAIRQALESNQQPAAQA